MIRTIALPLAAAALSLTGCATVQPDADGVARARIGETAYVGGPKVTPLMVLEDSRCPADVRCVWAGQVRLTVRIDTGAGYVTREIISNKPISVADGTLELVEVMPARVSASEPIRKTDYSFGFRFSGGL
ncbi:MULTISPECIES: hypothetical protein [unclassified Novosphingobium]|uniref:hypothetical protein n=1 Tax=unclassified Novosphingobium TaxID=2644732 RepID=UPI000EC9796D|nr:MULTISPECIES: hypothetical protein [unclassified Novosphingobium]HCF25399.1 hypothetical protein [Novosphingobium sp.]HQV04156.1 hypothetical protein [Novosphingobium sp.]